MNVRDWMSPDPVTAAPDATVASARATMESAGIRHLPIVDGQKLVGIVSDRDIAIRDAALRAALADHTVGELLDDDRPVEAVMSPSPHVVDVDASLRDAARAMVSRHINALPVMDDGRLAGIITSVDCLLAYLDERGDRPGGG